MPLVDERQLKELEKSEAHLRLAMEIGRMGSWVWNIREATVEWSAALEAIHGLEPGAFEGTFEAYQRDIHPEDRDRVLSGIRHTLEHRTPHHLQYRIVLPGGRVRWVEARGRLFGDDRGEPERLIGICMDVTERKAAEDALADHRRRVEESEARAVQRAEELARLTERLKRSNAELDVFAYAASHDLRAPLRGIANLAQWIEEDLQGSLPEETREMLALLRSRMHRMENLIEGILQYSRAGRMHEAPVRVDVRRLVEDVVDLLSPATATVRVDPDLPRLVTERLPLQQVFQNLIGNAIKHGGPGVHVTIGGEDAGAFWTFRVSDTGPGIAPEFHDRIWGIFQTLEARDKVEGTGIGLSLVKKLVEAQGGAVTVESAPDAGATFAFTWPKTRTPEDA
jgi:PAS domain S-box-containing protein